MKRQKKEKKKEKKERIVTICLEVVIISWFERTEGKKGEKKREPR
jgi:hypothetical protein